MRAASWLSCFWGVHVSRACYLWACGGFAGEASCVGACLFSSAPTPIRREVVVAREMQAEKAQASLNSGGSTAAACCSASSCAKLCTNCSPLSATCGVCHISTKQGSYWYQSPRCRLWCLAGGVFISFTFVQGS